MKAGSRSTGRLIFKHGTPELDHPLEYYQNPSHLPDFLGLLRNKTNWLDEGGKYEQSNTVSRYLLGAADANCLMEVPVTITPSKNVKNLQHRRDGYPSDPTDLDDSNGFVVARIINASNCTTTPLALDPGTYYWIVRQKPDKSGYESVFISDVSGQTIQTARFMRCPHKNAAEHKKDYADSFAKGIVCNNEVVNTLAPIIGGSEAYHASEVMKRLVPDRSPSTSAVFTADDFTLWFTCELGCCYADQFAKRSSPARKGTGKPSH